jgi:hypothetical protein
MREAERTAVTMFHGNKIRKIEILCEKSGAVNKKTGRRSKGQIP